MKKSKFSHAEVKRITGATRHELVDIPHYHAPPYLEVLREKVKLSLSSSGGRPTLQKAELVRKVRFSEEVWRILNQYSISLSQNSVSISPAQIASFLLEETLTEIESKITGGSGSINYHVESSESELVTSEPSVFQDQEKASSSYEYDLELISEDK
jgi:hypothetical protein